jgi:hypothetical protein
VLRTNGLTITGDAYLDVADNDLIVQSDAADREAMLARLTQYIRTARNTGPMWQRPGIRSSAAANDATTLTGLLILLNEANGQRIWSEFDGQQVDENCIIVKYSWNGDMDLNEQVNALDYARINQGFLSQNTPDPLGGCQNGDLDYSQQINALDYALINGGFLGQKPALPKVPAMSRTAAPAGRARAASPSLISAARSSRTSSAPGNRTVRAASAAGAGLAAVSSPDDLKLPQQKKQRRRPLFEI